MDKVDVVGIIGQIETCQFLEPSCVTLEEQYNFDYAFLWASQYLSSLMGRNELCKLQVTVKFTPDKIELIIPIHQIYLLEEEEKGGSPDVLFPRLTTG